MKTMLVRLFLILLILNCAACYRTSYKFSIDQGKTFTNSYWNNYFIYGLAPVKERYSPEDLCGDNQISRLETQVGGANFLAALFSLGLSPSNTMTVQCVIKGNVNKETANKENKAR